MMKVYFKMATVATASYRVYKFPMMFNILSQKWTPYFGSSVWKINAKYLDSWIKLNLDPFWSISFPICKSD